VAALGAVSLLLSVLTVFFVCSSTPGRLVRAGSVGLRRSLGDTLPTSEGGDRSASVGSGGRSLILAGTAFLAGNDDGLGELEERRSPDICRHRHIRTYANK